MYYIILAIKSLHSICHITVEPFAHFTLHLPLW